MTIYQADYKDGEMEAFACVNDDEAIQEAFAAEEYHGGHACLDVFELDDDYNIIRRIF